MFQLIAIIIVAAVNFFAQVDIYSPSNRNKTDFKFSSATILIRNNTQNNLARIDSLVWIKGTETRKLICYWNTENVIDSCLLIISNEEIFNIKYVFEYNTFGKLKKISEFAINNEGAWYLFAEEIFSYYGGHKIKSFINYFFHNNNRIKTIRGNYLYKENFRQVRSRVWNGHYWEDFSKENDFYSNGRMDSILSYQLGDEYWEKFLKFNYFYNEENLIDKLTVFFGQGSLWVETYKWRYKYVGKQITKQLLLHKIAEREWENYGRFLYNYNENNLPSEIVFEWWIDSRKIWQQGASFPFSVKLSQEITYHFEVSKANIYYSQNNTPNTINNELIPEKFELYQNYPNPFNPVTTIKYGIPSVIASEPDLSGERGNLLNDVIVTLNVYNILGEKIATLVNEKQSSGTYAVKFDASNLPSGVYFYTLRVGNFIATKKMILLK